MADRTIKPDDTNDLVLQNNDGSSKLELNEDQTVKVTTGSDAGEDFTINTSQLVVEGDTGNCGFGTATPNAPIDIEATHSYNTDASNHADGLRLTNSSTGNMSIEWWHSTDGGTEFASIVGQTDDLGSGTYDDGNIVFRTKFDGTMSNSMLIQSNGNVAIGNDSANVLLDIGDGSNGSAGVTGRQVLISDNIATVYDGTDPGTWGSGIKINNADATSNRTSAGITFEHRTSSSGVAGIFSTSEAAGS